MKIWTLMLYCVFDKDSIFAFDFLHNFSDANVCDYQKLENYEVKLKVHFRQSQTAHSET